MIFFWYLSFPPNREFMHPIQPSNQPNRTHLLQCGKESKRESKVVVTQEALKSKTDALPPAGVSHREKPDKTIWRMQVVYKHTS